MPKDQNHSLPKDGGFLSGLVWGIALGAFGLFLFGTDRGNKLRRYLRSHGQKLLDELEEIYDADKATEAGEELPTLEKKLGKSLSESGTNHIQKLQARGRATARRFFRRSGRLLR